MRNTLFTLVALIAFLPSAIAQKPYIRVGFGYHTPNAGQTRDVGGAPINGKATYIANSGITSMDAKSASYGAGASCNIALGYMANKHVGIELNGLIGIATAKNTSVLHIINGNTTQDETFKQYVQTPIMLVPALVMKSGGNVNLYTRLGLVLPLRSRVRIEGMLTSPVYPGGIRALGTIYTNFNIGFAASLGAEIKIVDHVNCFIEANMQSLSLYVKQVDFDRVSTYYKKKFSGTSTGGSYAIPFGNVGATGGISFSF